MLRIVLELHYVHVPIRAQHQLALRTAPHPPDMLHRQYRQARSRLLKIPNRILSAFTEMFSDSEHDALFPIP
jgi:hypothetical protein